MDVYNSVYFTDKNILTIKMGITNKNGDNLNNSGCYQNVAKGYLQVQNLFRSLPL